MWMLTSLFAPAFGLAGAADRPWKPRAAWAAGERQAGDDGHRERHPCTTNNSSFRLLPFSSARTLLGLYRRCHRLMSG